MSCEPYINLKRGDDLYLEFTATDPSTPTAQAAKLVLDTAQAANPQIPGDISAATSLYNAALVVDITSWTMVSQIRWYDRLIDTPVITVIDPLIGRFNLTVDAANTSLWIPNRTLNCDIQFTLPTFGVVSSETFLIQVQKDIYYA